MDVSLAIKFEDYLKKGRRERLHQNHEAARAAFEIAAAIDPLNVLVKIELAAELRALNDLDGAEAALNTVLDAGPHQVRIFIERGHLSRLRGDHEAAAGTFKSAAALDPHNRNIQVELARDLRELGRIDEVGAILDRILEAEPQQIGALVERGHILRQNGDYEGAIVAFKAAAATTPENFNIQVEIARDLRTLNRIEEADAVIEDVLKADPRHFGALVGRGHLALARTNYNEALSAFDRAASAHPDHTGLRLEIANVLRLLGRLGDAESVLRALMKSGNESAIIRLSHLLMDTNRLDEAQTVLAHALQKDANNARVLAARGHLARRRGDRPAARQFFASASELAPADIDLRLDLAAEMREQGDFDGALLHIQSVLKVADHWGALMQLGQLNRAKDDGTAAIAAFRRAAAKNPLNPQALVELAKDTWASGDSKEAGQLIARAFEVQPNDLGALLTSAEFALRSQRQDEALQKAQQAIAAHPGELSPYLIAARAAAYGLDREQAYAILDRARGIFGSPFELIATHVHLLRYFRDFNAARSLLASVQEQNTTSFALWLETTSFAIAMGDFAKANAALASVPANSKREFARVPLLRAKIAESRWKHRKAIAHYQNALALDPGNGVWSADLARIYLLLADVESARIHLRSAFERDSGNRISIGQSMNISQHHVGQMIEEFELDSEVLIKAKEAVALPDSEQIEPLKQLVRDNPNHTAPAILMMLALRKTGAFAPVPNCLDVSTPAKIPRRIAQYWHSEIIPEDVAELMQTWRDVHGDFEHIVFNDKTAEEFLRAHCPDAICRAFQQVPEAPQRADIFRLAYLASKGGVFVDADDRCLARLDTFAFTNVKFMGYQDDYGAIASNFVGAIPDHPVIVLALENAVKAVRRGDRDIMWLSTGPGVLTRAFAKILADATSNFLKSVSLVELSTIQRAVGIHCPARYKISRV